MCEMLKYLFDGSYTLEVYRGLVAEGSSKRIEAIKQTVFVRQVTE